MSTPELPDVPVTARSALALLPELRKVTDGNTPHAVAAATIHLFVEAGSFAVLTGHSVGPFLELLRCGMGELLALAQQDNPDRSH